MPRVEFPDGNHAELRDPEDLRRADVRAALKAADKDGINLMSGSFGLDGMAALQDALMLRFIRMWSLKDENGDIPVTAEAIADLRTSYYEPLAKIVAPALQAIMSGGDQMAPQSEAPSSTPGNEG